MNLLLHILPFSEDLCFLSILMAGLGMGYNLYAETWISVYDKYCIYATSSLQLKHDSFFKGTKHMYYQSTNY